MKSNKPKVAIINLTSCSGCLVEIINLGERLLDILEYIEIVNFPLVEGRKALGQYDITFIEGSPITKENIEDLERIRQKSKFLIALGICACIGGIPKIKNYYNKDKLIKTVYQSVKKIDNPLIKPLKEYVKVDFEIPGCPPDKNEIYWVIKELLAGKIPKIQSQPVCYECQIREYECLLQKGLPCLGPVILGGCEAICLKSGEPCGGCRGLLDNAKVKNFKKLLKEQRMSGKKLNSLLEGFGIRDQFEKLCQEK
ncbi:hypothetical protein ISS21_00040 [Patescibacteria group bacterium]|nr:hypothetical protein [Patescibacteria group bacterium]